MTPTTDLAASLIEAGRSGYAAAAAARLIEDRPEAAGRFGAGAFSRWQEHLAQRLRELAAALLVSEPELFITDVVWSRQAFAVREVPIEDLEGSLVALGEVLGDELPEDSRRRPLEYLSLAREALDRPALEPPAMPTASSEEERLTLAYLEAALSGDRRRAIDTVLAAVDRGLPAEAAYERVLAAAQGKVGEMWHRWEVSVSQEHFVTATTRLAMGLLALRFDARASNGKTVLVSVVPGNGHDLAAQALADFFDTAGWRSIHLGGELPAAELAEGAAAFEADLVALSMALSTQIRSTIEVVRKISVRRPGTPVLVGGRVFAAAPELWKKIGADAMAVDFQDAVRVAAGLVL